MLGVHVLVVQPSTYEASGKQKVTGMPAVKETQHLVRTSARGVCECIAGCSRLPHQLGLGFLGGGGWVSGFRVQGLGLRFGFI